jgi:quercetin dioxygenase-like cupin family protein
MKPQKLSFEEAPKVPFNLDGKVMFSSEKLEIVHLTLKPGEQVGLHTQSFDVIFFVLAGNAILETPSENIAGTENTSIFVPAGVQRGWKNNSVADFKVLVIKDLV